jgi:ABC-type amino acid transport substrate-binding protein
MNQFLRRLRAAIRNLCAPLLVAAAVAPLSTPAIASGVGERVQARGELRVCIWPQYYGISLRDPRTGVLRGLDIDLAAAFAADLGVRLTHVDSSFPTLVADLLADRCDVAMFGVAMLPARMEQLRFARPYLASDVYAVTTRASRVVQRWEDIDRPGVRVAVQAGTFMEPVMAAALKQATLVRVALPATRERELEAGRVDVFMTDYPYSRRLLDNADWARLLAPPVPFHVLPYAHAVKPGDDAWWQQVDAFVARIQADGRLEAAAARHGLLPIVRLK